MKQATVLHISKLDAARRQLEVAIRLYFFDDDPVSIYTLGAASYGILRDYAASKGVELQTAEQGILRRVVPGKKRELMAALRKHQNFFKHANKDPDTLIEFDPESIEYLLFDGAVAYSQLTAETTPTMATFNLWWQYQHRGLIKEEFSADRERLETQSSIFEGGRRKYFARVLPLLQHPHAA
jgi:hypothetical protein